MSIHHDLKIDDCRTTCISINKCNGFNYDWQSKNCTLLFDSSFGPSNIKILTTNKNIAFYMKSQDECSGIYHFINSNYGILFIFIIVILPCWCYIIRRKIKSNSRMRRTMSRISLIDNSIPPPYEERIAETIAPTSHNTSTPIIPSLQCNDIENEYVPEYTLTIQNHDNDDNEVDNDASLV